MYFYANGGLAFKLVVAGAIVMVYGFARSPVQYFRTKKHAKVLSE